MRSRKAKRKRFSTKLLDRGENHVSTIENWNRQEVEDRQVDVDEDDEPKEFFESYPGEDAQVVDDSTGPLMLRGLASDFGLRSPDRVWYMSFTL